MNIWDDPFSWFLVLLAAASVGFAIWYFFWFHSRSRMMLERWATNNGYRLLSSELRGLRRRGPFFLETFISRRQAVYFVVVQTPEGEIRRGWVRCGSFWWGMLQDEVEVRWEE